MKRVPPSLLNPSCPSPSLLTSSKHWVGWISLGLWRLFGLGRGHVSGGTSWWQRKVYGVQGNFVDAPPGGGARWWRKLVVVDLH